MRGRDFWFAVIFIFAAAAGFTLSFALAFDFLPTPDQFKSFLVTRISKSIPISFAEPLFAAVLTAGVVIIPLPFVVLLSWLSAHNYLRTQEGQDLFYYIGFLMTLIGLFFSSVKIATTLQTGSTPGMIGIFLQNIVALLSTIVGLIVRNIFAYIYPPQETERQTSDFEAAAKLEETTARIVANVERFSQIFASSTSELVEQSPAWEKMQTAIAQLESTLRELQGLTTALGESQAALRSSASQTTSALNQHAVAITEVTPQLAARLSQIQGMTRELSASLDHIENISQRNRQSGGAASRRRSIWGNR